jgi:hypothetical protein
MEIDSSLLCSQEPATGPYTEIGEPSSQPSTLPLRNMNILAWTEAT